MTSILKWVEKELLEKALHVQPNEASVMCRRALRGRLLHDIVKASDGVGDIRQSPEVGEAMVSLHVRERVPRAGDVPTRITDYVAGMTDRFALSYADSL